MKIIIHDLAAHSFVYQLSNELAKCSSYKITHITSSFFSSPNQGNLTCDSDILELIKIDISREYSKTNLIKRRKADIEYGKKVIIELKKIKPDVFINCISPLDSTRIIYNFCIKNNIKFISWLQDIYSLAIISVLKKKIFLRMLAHFYYKNIEKKILINNSHIIVISKNFEKILLEWGVDRNKISIIPNWANNNILKQHPKINNWSVRNNLHDKFCFMYAGTLGFKHNPKVLLELANKFKEDNNVVIVIVSEGLGADFLKKEIINNNLSNCLVFNFQPSSIISEVLSSADVLISILGEDAGTYSVPSKVLSYICVGRPVLLSVPKDNLVSEIVINHTLGFVSEPNNIIGFLDAAERLYKNDDLRKNMGKNNSIYARENFQIGTKISQFINVLNMV